MNLKEKIKSVLESLGFTQKFEEKTLSPEEFATFESAYKEAYQTSLKDDIVSADADKKTAEQSAELQKSLNTIQAILKGNTPEEAEKSANDPEKNATLEGIVSDLKTLKSTVKSLAEKPTDDKPAQIVTVSPVNINGFGNTPQYLFGVEHPMFSMDSRWNKIAANPRLAKSMVEADDSTDGVAFHKAVSAYSKSLKARFAYLQENKMLDAKALSTGTFANNYEGVATAGLGDQFVILRQDALIARVLQKRDLTQLFPVAYGYQDRAIVFNAFLDEVSQPYQSGEVFKGGMKIENQMGYVDDLMIKIEWGPMKELERKYIGYLNKEGSDPIKWTMIEFQLLNTLVNAQVEQNKRRIRGIYVTPEKGVASPAINGSTGLLYTLLRYVHQFDLKPHDDVDYASYTSATMLAAVQEFIADVRNSISEDMSIDQHVIYLNYTHQAWWIKNVRSTYGKDTDFTGPMGALNTVPDTTTHIIWLPYLGQLPFMMLHEPGNIQFLENLPGEMLDVKMTEQMEQVRAWSTWKEGTSASFTGRRFATKAEMDANNFDWQQIFINRFAYTITDAVDGANGFWQVTDAATTLVDVVDITNAKAGVAYCIECGDVAKLPGVTKAGKFANITAAFKATAVGDYIMVILGSDGNFRELERCVGGVRTINKELQPNVPGGR